MLVALSFFASLTAVVGPQDDARFPLQAILQQGGARDVALAEGLAWAVVVLVCLTAWFVARVLTRRLSDDFLDLDLLDEMARQVLGHMRPDEIVLFESAPPEPNPDW